MSRDSTLAAFSKLTRRTGGPERSREKAPHKPLLVLYALSQWLRHGTTMFRFADIEEPVGTLDRDARFGGADSASARDPFCFLTNDGVWVVESGNGAEIEDVRNRPTPRELRDWDLPI
jgi:putative restriction endonuclease